METFRFFGLVTALIALVQAGSDNPLKLRTSPADGSRKIFVGEKTLFNVTVHFPKKVYNDVIIDVQPSIDLPDIFINSIKNVKVGSNLRITGSTKPVMDYGRTELQTPGKALSCQFHLGKVVHGRKSRKPDPEGDAVLIQYEALIPEDRSEGFAEIGHSHMYAVNVHTADSLSFCYDFVTVSERSLPILFQTLKKFPTRKGNTVKEMVIDKVMPQKNLFF